MDILNDISSLLCAALLLWVVLDLNRIKSRLDSMQNAQKSAD